MTLDIRGFELMIYIFLKTLGNRDIVCGSMMSQTEPDARRYIGPYGFAER